MRSEKLRLAAVTTVALLLVSLIVWVVVTNSRRVGAVPHARLGDELSEARKVALRYPTVADAKAAGYKRIGLFSPGAGAHYAKGKDKSGPGTVDVDRPLAYLYDGVSPTSRVVGLMYYSESEKPPDGFAGPDDHWHRHGSVCSKRTNGAVEILLPGDADVTRAQCDAVGGRFQTKSGWMLHVWVVPGWESPDGVFSHANPRLRCADGTYDVDRLGSCAGT